MTCLVAYKDKSGTIYLGGDSAGSDTTSHSILTRRDPKVFILESMLIGFCGSYRDGQLIMTKFKIPSHDAAKYTDFGYMCGPFIDAVRKLLKDNGRIKEEEKLEGTEAGFIIVFKDEIYKIYEDFQVELTVDPFNAAGSGADIALGALNILHNSTGYSPDEKVAMAIRTSAKYNLSVREPALIISTLDLEGNK